MRKLLFLLLGASAAALLAGCTDDTTAPRDTSPPAAPRGVFSVTGDHAVTLHWFRNTESDVKAYRVYVATCGDPDCAYTRVATTTADSFVVSGLTNGVTRFFAVDAVDWAGNQSPLSYETIYDTPRPAGTNAAIANSYVSATGAGWDFSAAQAVASTNPLADIVYFKDTGSFRGLYAADLSTDIQDMGWTPTFDTIGFAPPSGWSPTGSAEAIVGHTYVVWTRDSNFAKFRITNIIGDSAILFDWAYQTDVNNGELRARPVRDPARAARPWVQPS